LAKALENDARVEALVGVDLEEPPIDVKGLEFVRVDIRNPLVARVLEATAVDTIVHTNILSSPSVIGGRSQMKETNVIGTMQLLGAAQRSPKLARVVMKSSPAIYGWGSGTPSIIPESHAARPVDLAGFAKDCADAETHARDFGRRRNEVDLVILRTQAVIGPTVTTGMTDYLSLPVVLTVLGYDPRLQFLHEQDAVAAFVEATFGDVSGIFNIAAPGAPYLSKALRMLGRVQIPLVLPAAGPLAAILRQLDLVDFPMDQLRLLRHGRVIDTSRARTTLGFEPRFTSEEALLDFRDHRDGDFPVDPGNHPAWERELFEYLRKRADTKRESV
jgi:UDP-glucose 4-epimerase